MIFIDTNIPMYLIGADETIQQRARAQIEDAIAVGDVLCTDAEVLQEILHRYVAIRRPEFIDPAFETLLGVVDVVYPIEREDVERGRRVVKDHKSVVGPRRAPHRSDAAPRCGSCDVVRHRLRRHSRN